jgi:hypothetical protein
MAKRVFWIALGATVGILVASKASKTLRKFSPTALADGAAGVPGTISGAVRGFLDDVHYAAAEREMELYRALGTDIRDTDRPRDN